MELQELGILIGDADKKEYVKYFHEGCANKRIYKEKLLPYRGFLRVRIERTSPSQVVVHIHTGKAGLIIGRKGAEIDALRAKLEKLTGKKVTVKVQEIKDLKWRCCISCRIDSCSNRKENSLQKSYDSSYIKIYEISRS